MFKHLTATLLGLAILSGAASARQPDDPAAAFGVRESVQSISLSPDGRMLAYVAPSAGQGSILYTVDIAGGEPRAAVRADGVEQRLAWCEFVGARRLVCLTHAVTTIELQLVDVSRLVALDTDGANMRVLGERDSFDQQYQRLRAGRVIDYLPGIENSVLMMQQFVPDARTGSRMGRRGEGLGVVRIDTSNLRSATIEQPREEAIQFISDGRGTIRVMSSQIVSDATGEASNRVDTYYRRQGASTWEALGSYDRDPRTGQRRSGAVPLAVDPQLNAAYLLEKVDGRDALFRIALDGTMRRELVASNPGVDIDGLLRIGRSNRVVGATFATERRVAHYFDPEIWRLAQQLHRALPGLPMIDFVDASEDESKLLVRASSDSDPGRYYLYDRGTRQLAELMLARPELEDVPLATVRPVNYRAADGTMIPAYLTLPPGGAQRGLPAIVMPHGGPGARDEWGFDWLPQYFANRGFAVLQPNFRGSTGYGDAWFQQNGFRSWRTAVGDVADAGRWLVSERIADPAKLAILGWSFGGYAALQANVLDPTLFRAAIAIAPVTDLELLRGENDGASLALFDFIGTGAHIREGSPAQNAATIRAPVLMFHGLLDRNVGIRQSRLMRNRLRDAGRMVELVEYRELDHQLDDSIARADVLRRSDAFLRQALGVR